jgi:hypothetical protein
LKRLAAQAEHGAAVTPEAEKRLAVLVSHARAWGKAIADVVAFQGRFPQLTDATSLDDQRRLSILSNIYGLQLTVGIQSEPIDAEAEGHSHLSTICAYANDLAGRDRHGEAGVEALTRAIALASERPALYLDRAFHYISLGRTKEARADLEECLRRNPVAGGLSPELRRTAEETLKNLK